MQVIEEFKMIAGKVTTIKKLDTTFNVWVTEVRELQRQVGFDNMVNSSMNDLRRYYDNAYLPKQAIQVMKRSYSNTY